MKKTTTKKMKATISPWFCLFLLSTSFEANSENLAHVTAVKASGNENNYRFSVTIKSPDTGCEQYANWWEVLSADGQLLYRRILGHSHVNEQPFTRSGSTVKAGANDTVYIRAHMFPSGFGGDVFVGSVASGFKVADAETLKKVQAFSVDTPKTNCAF